MEEGRHRGASIGWDVAVALVLFAIGAAFALSVFDASGRLYFYQLYYPELVYAGCGFGLIRPDIIPAGVVDFLSLRSLTFDCAILTAPAASQPAGIFLRAHLYFSLIVRMLWRGPAIDYQSLWPLVAGLAGFYAAGCFALLRRFFGLFPATAGALLLACSPIALGLVIYLRDYGKAPFFVWALAALIAAVQARPLRMKIVLAAAAGAIVGVGYGFRSDLIILLPAGLLYLVVASRTWRARLSTVSALGVTTLLLAAPMLSIGNGGGFGTLIMQGMSEPFRHYLDLGPAPYAMGTAYSDELVLSSVAADLSAADPDWASREGVPGQGMSQSILRSGRYVGGWLGFFAGDIATQALKSAAWILEMPSLMSQQRRAASWLVPATERSSAGPAMDTLYDAIASPWLAAVCALGWIVLLARIAGSDRRAAAALGILISVLLLYTAIQFSLRHVFHLEFIWVAGVLALMHATFWIESLRRAGFRFYAVVAVAAMIVVVAQQALVHYQDRTLRRQFAKLLAQPRIASEIERSPDVNDGKATVGITMPESFRAVVEGPVDSMNDRMGENGVQAIVLAGADRLLLSVGGPRCTAGPLQLTLRYTKTARTWQPLESRITVDVPSDAAQRTMVLVPVFYRATQRFTGIALPEASRGCITAVERVAGPTRLPLLLTATLTPGWQERPLHRAFGGFPVRDLEPLRP